MDSSKNNVEFEVEQKFALDNGTNVEARLLELGFSKTGEIDMVDWYFDLPEPQWVLTPNDHWLRFRETEKKSSWQLKRGREHKDGATVYEELEGKDAMEASISILKNVNHHVTTTIPPPRHEYQGHVVPQLARRPTNGLIPFARIETHRSSWSYLGESDMFTGLVVDLDGTQYGYMVGEIEAVVYNDSDISLARKRIASLLQKLVPEQSTSLHIPVGKLEHFLIRHCPDHYKACVEGGSIPQQA